MAAPNIDVYYFFHEWRLEEKWGTLTTITIIFIIHLGDRGDWKSEIPALQWISFRDAKKGYPNVNVVGKTIVKL